MRLLMTGGSGRLGTELRALLAGAYAPLETELDITDETAFRLAVESHSPTMILHLAAYADVKRAETNRSLCWNINVSGTRNVVRAADSVGARLLHISTDYVFAGTQGMYREDDPLGPPANYYALTKIAAEEVARVGRRCLVVRTSFRPRVWPYPTAFADVHTSQDYVDVIAPLLVETIQHIDQVPFDVLHVATERKTIYELARRRAPEVKPASCESAGVNYPRDTSLDISRWEKLRASWR